MASPRKRPVASTKPAGGSVEDLRRRAAALREEADRLVPAKAVDPVFDLIAAHRTAFTKWDLLCTAWNEMVPDGPDFTKFNAAAAVEVEAAEHERAAFRALLATHPTTVAGVLALLAHVPEVTRKVSGEPDAEAQKALDALREGALRCGVAQAASPAEPTPDAELISACDGAVRIVDALNGPLASLPEGAFNACMAETEKLIEFAIATPATTREGLVGKARILKGEWPCNVSVRDKLDNGDLLIRSLIWDLAGKEACA